MSSKRYDISQSMKILMFSLLGLALGAKIFGFLTGIYRNIGNGEKVTLETMLDTGIVFYGLFVVGFCIELFNMGCAILTCDCDKPMVFDWSGMWGLLFICTIGGAVVGMVLPQVEKRFRNSLMFRSIISFRT